MKPKMKQTRLFEEFTVGTRDIDCQLLEVSRYTFAPMERVLNAIVETLDEEGLTQYLNSIDEMPKMP